MIYSYPYPRAAITVDAAVFRIAGPSWEILLIRRAKPPFHDIWALPGGFIEMDETLEEAVKRELSEETGIRDIRLEQLHTFSAVDRDPRHRTISTVFWGILNNGEEAIAGDDASEVSWFKISDLPELAFDHESVIEMALRKLD